MPLVHLTQRHWWLIVAGGAALAGVAFYLYMRTPEKEIIRVEVPVERKPEPQPVQTGPKPGTLALFHAEWCHNCKKIVSFWPKISDAIGQIGVNVKDFEDTANRKFNEEQGIEGYPTIRYYNSEGKVMSELKNSAATANDVMAWLHPILAQEGLVN